MRPALVQCGRHIMATHQFYYLSFEGALNEAYRNVNVSYIVTRGRWERQWNARLKYKTLAGMGLNDWLRYRMAKPRWRTRSVTLYEGCSPRVSTQRRWADLDSSVSTKTDLRSAARYKQPTAAVAAAAAAAVQTFLSTNLDYRSSTRRWSFDIFDVRSARTGDLLAARP